jgi:integrase
MTRSTPEARRHHTSSSSNPPDASHYEARIAALEKLIVSQALEIDRLRSGGLPEPNEATISGMEVGPVSAPPPKASAPKIKEQPVLPVGQFEQAALTMSDNKKADWEPESRKHALTLVELFTNVLVEEGVAHSGQIRQHHLAALRSLMNDMPSAWGRSKKKGMPVPTPTQLRTRGDLARRQGKPVGLSVDAVRRHFTNLRTFLRHLRASGYALDADLTLEGLVPKKRSKAAQRRSTVKPGPDRIQDTLLKLPAFTGCVSDDAMHEVGTRFYHCGTTLVTIGLIYTGARSDELCNLDTADVDTIAGIPVFRIRFSETKRVKNDQSERVIPIPDELIRLKILAYADRIKALGYPKLFPDLFNPFTDTPPGDTIYDALKKLIERSPRAHGGGLDRYWSKLIHALRHGFNSYLNDTDVKDSLRRALLGHAPSGTNEVVYSEEAKVQALRQAMRKYPVITGHLAASPVRLLPIVERRDPRMWGNPRKDWDGRLRLPWNEVADAKRGK